MILSIDDLFKLYSVLGPYESAFHETDMPSLIGSLMSQMRERNANDLGALLKILGYEGVPDSGIVISGWLSEMFVSLDIPYLMQMGETIGALDNGG